MALVLLILCAIFDFLGIWLRLYWQFFWFDTIPHFLGGATVGAAVSSFWLLKDRTKKSTILMAIVGALFVGIIWELFELYFGITSLSDGIRYVTDTTSDVIMDISGAIFSGLIAFRILEPV